jgi:carboxyl-terminal processing protease
MEVKLNPLGGDSNAAAAKPARSRITVVAFVVTIIVAAAIAFALGTRADDFGGTARGDLDYSSLDELYRTLAKNYDGDIDPAALIEGAKKGLAAATGDPYTEYFTAKEAADFLGDLNGSFEGIGIELGKRDNNLTIVSVLDGSPALRAGLKAGDLIAKVNDNEALDWSAEQAAATIRGAKGTTVKLSVVRDGTALDFTVTRDRITDPSVKYEIKDGIGIIRVTRFSDSDTASLTRKAAQEFKAAGVKGIVLDLRGNGGGYVNAARDLASLWLPAGDVIVVEKQAKTDKTLETVRSIGPATLRGLPTVVLIDEYSASASEILAGALRDHDAATLVGKKSYGKGVVQQMVELPSGAQLKVTVAKWYTPNGRNIGEQGIEPDVKVDFSAEEYAAGRDTQLDKAVEILNKK